MTITVWYEDFGVFPKLIHKLTEYLLKYGFIKLIEFKGNYLIVEGKEIFLEDLYR